MKILVPLFILVLSAGCVSHQEAERMRQKAYEAGYESGVEVEKVQCTLKVQKLEVQHKEDIAAAQSSAWSFGYVFGIGSTLVVLVGVALLAVLIGSNIFLVWRLIKNDSPDI